MLTRDEFDDEQKWNEALQGMNYRDYILDLFNFHWEQMDADKWYSLLINDVSTEALADIVDACEYNYTYNY